MVAPIYTPTQLEKGLRAEFLQTFARAMEGSVTNTIATTVGSTNDNEKYGWVGEAPQMEEIKDQVKFFDITDTGYTITNTEYGAGLAVRRRDVMNDNTGGIMLRTRQLATVAAHHSDKLCINALVNGTTLTGYDGISFFSDSHTARGDSGTIDNLLAGSGTTTANIATDINAALKYFGEVKAENGEPFHGDTGVSEVTFVLPWGLRKAFAEATGATIISNTSNVQVDGLTIRMVISGRITDANDFYALATGGPLRPLIYQLREGVQFAALENNASDTAFVQHKYLYKATAYHAVGYGPFQAACKFVNA